MNLRDLKRRLEQLEARLRGPAPLAADDDGPTRAQALDAMEREAARLQREGRALDAARLRGLVALVRGQRDGAISDDEVERWAVEHENAGRNDRAFTLRAVARERGVEEHGPV